jgi:CheY-like chemotaxis protein
VLVAEDEVRMAALLARGLGEEGYLVDVATTGPDALRLALEHDYAVVLLDVMLPKMDGIEVCRRLREHQRFVPVLMLTARDSLARRSRGLAAGADDYLVKPFAFGDLTARIAALISRCGVRAPAVVSRAGEFGSLKWLHCGDPPIPNTLRRRSASSARAREPQRPSLIEVSGIGPQVRHSPSLNAWPCSLPRSVASDTVHSSILRKSSCSRAAMGGPILLSEC